MKFNFVLCTRYLVLGHWNITCIFVFRPPRVTATFEENKNNSLSHGDLHENRPSELFLKRTKEVLRRRLKVKAFLRVPLFLSSPPLYCLEIFVCIHNRKPRIRLFLTGLSYSGCYIRPKHLLHIVLITLFALFQIRRSNIRYGNIFGRIQHGPGGI